MPGGAHRVASFCVTCNSVWASAYWPELPSGLPKAALASAQAALAEVTTDEAEVAVSLFSAVDKTGVDDAAQILYDWAHPDTRRPE